MMVRYADDIVVGFEHQADAERFMAQMRERLAAYALTLHGEKTRLIRFGRFAAQHRKERGEGKPETFNFLGFTHICGRSRRGGFQLRRKTRRDRMQARLLAIQVGLRRRMHTTLEQQARRPWRYTRRRSTLSRKPWRPRLAAAVISWWASSGRRYRPVLLTFGFSPTETDTCIALTP